MHRLTEAEAALDAALGPARQEADRLERARTQLATTLGQLTSQVRATSDFIDTRRGAVGPEARTRLAEAARLAQEAERTSATDPAAALGVAQRAASLAQSAQQLAEADVQRWQAGRSGGGGTGGLGGLESMVLGGILMGQSSRRGGGGVRRRVRGRVRRQPSSSRRVRAPLRARAAQRRRRATLRRPQQRGPLLSDRHPDAHRHAPTPTAHRAPPHRKAPPMAEKQTILGRIAQLTKANVNALLDRAEDPEKMLDQMVRDYTNSIAEAEDAVAVTIGNLRLAEADHAEDVAAAAEWGAKAVAASTKADQLRAAGNAVDADRFDNLAKIALGKQLQFEKEAKDAEPMIASQTEVVAKLKDGLVLMKSKLDDLRSKRDELVARAKSAQAQAQVQGAISSINVLDPTTEVSRFEEKVRREEAKVAGQAEIAASSLDAQFEELEDAGQSLEIEARLAALKSGGAPAQIQDHLRPRHSSEPDP